jgi:hypothetical protein
MLKAVVDVEKVIENDGMEELITFLIVAMKEFGYVIGREVVLPEGHYCLELLAYPNGPIHLYEGEYTIIPDVMIELEEML